MGVEPTTCGLGAGYEWSSEGLLVMGPVESGSLVGSRRFCLPVIVGSVGSNMGSERSDVTRTDAPGLTVENESMDFSDEEQS